MQRKEVIELAAKTAYTINNEFRAALGETRKPAWDDCTPTKRESLMYGVEDVLKGATPERGHENWLAFHQREGWTYGAVEDVVAKKHPCMLHYADLPPEQRIKDTLFHASARGVLIRYGWLSA